MGKYTKDVRFVVVQLLYLMHPHTIACCFYFLVERSGRVEHPLAAAIR